MIQEFRVDKYKLLFDLQPEHFVSDHNLLWYAQNRQYPEPEVVQVMLRALKPGDCAVDAGANVGVFTVLMSKIVGEHGRVIAVEPDERNNAKLRKNLDINSCGNVEAWVYALGRDRGQSGIRHHADNGQSCLSSAIVDQAVAVDTLDHVLRRLPKMPKLLKLDIEGSEVAALVGCTYDFPVIVAEVNDKALQRAGTSPADLFTLLRERGYHRYLPHANGAMPSRVLSSQAVKLTRENTNFLFARPGLVENELWAEVEA